MIQETLSTSDVKVNLLIMVTIWGVTVFNYYMITYLENTFEQVYIIALMVCAADILGYSTGGVLLKKVGVKRTFFLSFSLATLAGLLILAYGLQH